MIYLNVLHMIGQPKMNGRLHDMIPNWILLDVSVLPKKQKIQQASNFN